MSLPRFEVLHPLTVDEACSLLDKYSSEGVAVLAGGTDILVDIRKPIIPAHLPRCKGCEPFSGRPLSEMQHTPKYLVALSKIDDLRGIQRIEGDRIFIGSLTTISEVCKSDLVRESLTALAEGGDNLGSPLVRNRGTIGGNICNARPAADMLLPTYALQGQLELISPRGKRMVKVADFILGPGKTTREQDEILLGIHYPIPSKNSGSSMIKLANRRALEISVVNVASKINLDDNNGKIVDVNIAMGAVGPTPIIASKACKYLMGKKPLEEEFIKCGKIAAGECKPITDHRASAIYRMEMVAILVTRTLNRAMKRIEAGTNR